jgi:hypothetical protein
MTAHREITCALLRFQIVALLLSFVVAEMFWIGLELTDRALPEEIIMPASADSLRRHRTDRLGAVMP